MGRGYDLVVIWAFLLYRRGTGMARYTLIPVTDQHYLLFWNPDPFSVDGSRVSGIRLNAAAALIDGVW